MSISTTRRARITGPVSFETASGERQHIPLGPCLVDSNDGRSVDIVWGLHGQRSAALSLAALRDARAAGNLVLLD